MAMTVPGILVDPDDHRWASALADSPHDVYDTPAYVLAEAHRIGAEPVGFLVDDADRVFLLPLLLRADGDVDGLGEPSMRDAVAPYGYPGVVMNDTARTTAGFADACVARLLEVMRSAEICTAFIRLHPLLNADLSTQLHRYPVVENGVTVSIDLLQPEARIWAVMSKATGTPSTRRSARGFLRRNRSAARSLRRLRRGVRRNASAPSRRRDLQLRSRQSPSPGRAG